MNPDWPMCFACLRYAPAVETDPVNERWNKATGYLEKAHLVDHACGGLDGPQNLVPLCSPCHLKMPMFDIGHGPSAILWVRSGEVWPPGRALRLIRAAVFLRRDGLYPPPDGDRYIEWLPPLGQRRKRD
jgi:hypothetical protein